MLSTSNTRPSLTVMGACMLNVAVILSLRGIPMMAETGYTMFFYLAFSCLFFLIPTSLVSAELSTGWQRNGGVYVWVKEAFGSRWGFLAVWLQWIQNVIWYPTMLAFIASTLAYTLGKPGLASNGTYTFLVIVSFYWAMTIITFKGLRLLGRIATVGVLIGTILPVIMLIAFGVIGWLSEHTIPIAQSDRDLLPNLTHFSNIAFLAAIVLQFSGMEVGAVHVNELQNPKRDYPLAIFLAMFIIIIVFSMGSLSIAMVIPTHEISLTAGVMEAFQRMLQLHHLDWALPLIGILIILGTMVSILAWISGPSKGLLATAKNGDIPPFLAYTNQHGMQVHILLVQGIIVTSLASLYLLIDNVDATFFLLSAITVILYLMMYLLMFIAAIYLRYKCPNVKRAYQIPGKWLGIWTVGIIGILAVSFALIVSFVPPDALHIRSTGVYIAIILVSVSLCIVAPFIIHHYKKPEWLAHPHVNPHEIHRQN